MSSPAPAPAAGKICQLCKQDCSAKPRTKDAAGNYICNECMAARQAQTKAAATAPRPVPAAGRPVVQPAAALTAKNEAPDYLWGGKSTAAKGAPCPSCSTFLREGSKICTTCGYDVAGGRRMHTKITKEKAPKAERGRRRRGETLNISTWTLFAIFAVVYAGLFAGGIVEPTLVIVWAIALLIGGLVAFIDLVIGAFQDGNTFWGVIILGNFVPLLNLPCSLATLFYTYFINERPIPKALYGGMWVGSFIGGVLLGALAPDALHEFQRFGG